MACGKGGQTVIRNQQMEIKFDLIIEDGDKPAQGVDEELPLRK
jgi:hypothetical protein